VHKMHYVFVYGTLRKHEKYHGLLQDATRVAEQAWTNGSLFDTGLGYPAMKGSTTNMVYGELYLVTDEQLQKLDELEEYEEHGKNNLYDRKKQIIFYDTGKKNAYLYTITEHNENLLETPIQSCDWKLHRLLEQETILYFAYGSCLDDAGFRLANVNQLFQKIAGRGILKGYTLRYTIRFQDGDRADIVEDGGMVEGKVYEINRQCLSYLFKREGVQEGWYRPTFVDVTLNGKLIKDVLTFTVVKKESKTALPDH
jgi:gamma-glutamylcyclotransferase (GGCT)/AIG2-like uncharacterized protein YtfP